MPIAHLDDRAVVTVEGPDAETFLQNVITTDLATLEAGTLRPGALLTPQGKILFDFLIARAGDGAFLLECRKDVAEDFARRLTLYKLRARVEISEQDQDVVGCAWQTDSSPSRADSGWLRDLRFPDTMPAWRVHGALPDPTEKPADWHAFRIAAGVAESGPDYELGDAFPHDVLLEAMNGVGLRKGCYVGQEVVSRMHHRGTARRRVLIATGNGALPPAGTDIRAGERAIGRLGSTSDRTGLAMVRIDRAKQAMDAGTPITAGEVALDLAIPDWAGFAFPDSASDAEAG